jgi:hypothetical protein
MEDVTDTAFRPALREELDDLNPSLVSPWMTMIVTQCQFPLDGSRPVLPELLDGLVVEAVVQGTKNDPRQFARGKAWEERFEPGQFLDHRWRHASRFAHGHDGDIVREQPEHPLFMEAARELPHRFDVGLGFLRALFGGTIGNEDQRSDQLIAPLQPVDKVQLQLGKILGRVHTSSAAMRPWHADARCP